MAFAVLMLTACNSDGKYKVKNDTVVFTYWTFSFGTVEEELPEVDAASFESIKDWLGRDDRHVWFKSRLVTGADPATVKAEDFPLFRDKRDYYYQGAPIGVADKESFRVLRCDNDVLWASDSRFVYFDSLRIEDSDPATIEVIDTFEAKDKRHVYYFGKILEDADPATYEEMGVYSKDRSHVWYCGDIVEGADPETFKANSILDMDKPDAQDKYGDYKNGKRIGTEDE